jgi:hypothetical protein
VFADRAGLADAVNRLLVTGFYMFNLGYGLWVLKAGAGLDAFEAIQLFVRRIALLLLVLSVMHLLNVLVFWTIRQSRERRTMGWLEECIEPGWVRAHRSTALTNRPREHRKPVS